MSWTPTPALAFAAEHCTRTVPKAGRRQGRGPLPSEEQIHRAVADALARAAAPGVVWWHTPNGEARGKAAAGRLKAMGTQAGLPDLFLLHAGRLYGLELKTGRGHVSPAQKDRLDRLAAAGATVAVAYGLDAALVQIKAWGMLR